MLKRPPSVLKLLDLEPVFSFGYPHSGYLVLKNGDRCAQRGFQETHSDLEGKWNLLCFKNDNYMSANALSPLSVESLNIPRDSD